jgi:hypothetical protein
MTIAKESEPHGYDFEPKSPIRGASLQTCFWRALLVASQAVAMPGDVEDELRHLIFVVRAVTSDRILRSKKEERASDSPTMISAIRPCRGYLKRFRREAINGQRLLCTYILPGYSYEITCGRVITDPAPASQNVCEEKQP